MMNPRPHPHPHPHRHPHPRPPHPLRVLIALIVLMTNHQLHHHHHLLLLLLGNLKTRKTDVKSALNRCILVNITPVSPCVCVSVSLSFVSSLLHFLVGSLSVLDTRTHHLSLTLLVPFAPLYTTIFLFSFFSMLVSRAQDLLKEGSKHLSGIDEAVKSNIDACKDLAKIVRTSLGPNGKRSHKIS